MNEHWGYVGLELIPKVRRDTIESTSPRIIRHSHVFLIALFFNLLSIFHLAVSVGQSRTTKPRFTGFKFGTPHRKNSYTTKNCQSFQIQNSFKSSSGSSHHHYGNNLFTFQLSAQADFSLQQSLTKQKTLEAKESSHSGKRPWTSLARSSRECRSMYIYWNIYL